MSAPLSDAQPDAGAKRRRAQILLALIAALGLALRLYQLTRLSFWSDECLTLAVTAMDPGRILRIILYTDVHPPAHYYIIALWQRISNDEAFIRLLPVLLGTATIPLIYLVGSRLINRSVGLWAALLLAISPLHVVQSQQIRYPTLLTMLGMAMVYLVLLAMERERKGYALAAGLVGALMLYTNYFSLGIIGALGLVALVQVLVRREERWQGLVGPLLVMLVGLFAAAVPYLLFILGWKVWPGLLLLLLLPVLLGVVRWPASWSRPLMAPCIALALFLPWVPIMLLMMTRTVSNYHYPLSRALFHTALAFSFSTGIYGMPRGDANTEVLQFLGLIDRGWLIALMLAPFALLLIAGLISRYGERKRRLVLYALLFVSTGFSLFVCSRTRLYQPKYVMPSLPLLLIVLGAGLYNIGRWRRSLAVVLVLIVALLGARSLTRYYSRPLYNQEHYREIGRYLAQHARNSDALLFYHWISQQCTCYYMQRELPGVFIVPTVQQMLNFNAGRDRARAGMMLEADQNANLAVALRAARLRASGDLDQRRAMLIQGDIMSYGATASMLKTLPRDYERLWVLSTYAEKRDPTGFTQQLVRTLYARLSAAGVSRWAGESLALFDLHQPPLADEVDN
ncbi:MAG: glycosyltransferase family 39 protein [Candidatus Alcyoniella australis]|nr:glycosyltransferase family 39 protein [Candidatus Alcyoniella australis]